jgi:hypothetical protein
MSARNPREIYKTISQPIQTLREFKTCRTLICIDGSLGLRPFVASLGTLFADILKDIGGNFVLESLEELNWRSDCKFKPMYGIFSKIKINITIVKLINTKLDNLNNDLAFSLLSAIGMAL